MATVGDLAGYRRLRSYFTDTPPPVSPLPAPWRVAPLSFDDIDLFDDRPEGEATNDA